MRIVWIGDCADCVPTLARWHVAAFGEVVKGWQVETAAFELRTHAHRRALPTTLVALDDDGAPLGSVSLLESDRPAPDRLAPWLGTLYVQPERRAEGIGSALVRAAMAEAAALRLPCLHLWTPAHAGFYRRLGWRDVGPRRYGGVAATLMRYDMDASA